MKKVYVVTVSRFERAYDGVKTNNGKIIWDVDSYETEYECAYDVNTIVGIFSSMKKAKAAMQNYDRFSMVHRLPDDEMYEIEFDKTYDPDPFNGNIYRTLREIATNEEHCFKFDTRHTISITVYDINKQAK